MEEIVYQTKLSYSKAYPSITKSNLISIPPPAHRLDFIVELK